MCEYEIFVIWQFMGMIPEKSILFPPMFSIFEFCQYILSIVVMIAHCWVPSEVFQIFSVLVYIRPMGVPNRVINAINTIRVVEIITSSHDELNF